MTSYKTKITTHTLDKSGKLKPRKARSVSKQIAIAKGKTRKVVSPARARWGVR